MSDAQGALMSEDWYYTVEVESGVFTPGRDRANMAITRKLLRRAQYRGHDCLDIGTMEGVIPALLERGGARRVVACDRLDLTSRVKLVQQTYRLGFDYFGGVELHDVPALLDARGGRYFDLVVFSGVLYHLLNPLGLLATARGLCKVGGLLLVETAAIQHPEEKLVFNARGDLYGVVDNYFLPTTAWLDYALRMLGLEPLELAYIGSSAESSIDRVAVLCRSHAHPRPLRPDDAWPWYERHDALFGVAGQIDWTELRRSASDIGCAPADARAACDSRSLYDAIQTCPPYAFATAETRLFLDSTM